MKDQLIFDATDADTIADSDSVGAFVRSSDGTLITHTTHSGDEALDVSIRNTSIEVTGTQFDIDDLNATDDAVQAWMFDGTGNAIGSTAGAIDVHLASGTLTTSDAALADTAIESGKTALAVANTAEDVVGSPLASRKYLMLYNNDNRKMYVGKSGVSATTGFPVSPGSMIEMRAGASVDVEFVSAKATHDLRYMELS